jgi:hypothetical protein
MFVTGRVDLLWKQVEAQTNVVQVHESATQGLQASSGSGTYAPCKACGPGVSGAIGVPADEAAAPKPNDDGSVISSTLLKVIGDNGQCHCVHVTELIKQVDIIEKQLKANKLGSGTSLRADAPAYGATDPLAYSDPWRPAGAGGAGGDGGGGAGGGGEGGPGPGSNRDGMPRNANGKLTVPLTLREHIGSLGYKDKPAFDEKLSERAEYQHSGKAGTGMTWKGKVERHLISRAPVMMNILKWAEEQGLEKITEHGLAQAIGMKLTDEQQMVMNGQLWGFLSAAVSGSADTLFKGADALQGVDAWRILTRYILQGKDIRIETLRREMKIAVARPISGLDKMEEGIAEFEYAIKQYEDAGGEAYDLEMKKNDLLQVLPGELSELLLWMATDKNQSFQGFKDHVITMSGRILFNKRKSPLHAVVEPQPQSPAQEPGGDNELMAALASGDADEILAAVTKWKGRTPNRGGGGRFQNVNKLLVENRLLVETQVQVIDLHVGARIAARHTRLAVAQSLQSHSRTDYVGSVARRTTRARSAPREDR